MCTLTIIPRDADAARPAVDGEPRAAGVRIVCNRDESRMRPPATPPELRAFAGRRALLPIDPPGGGTWIAASDAPLALVLMNVYTRPLASAPESIAPRRMSPESRGTIIPHALAAASLREALARTRDLDLASFEPFRLVVADTDQFAEIVWADGRFAVSAPATIRGPLFFTSSGLGDEIVAGPRRKLFEQAFSADGDSATVQDSFHRHVWPGREFASVWMTRPEARTVSLTVIEMHRQGVRMSYYPREDDGSDARLARELSLAVNTRPADVVR